MSNSSHYLGHRARLKERLKNEPSSLEDYEVLELFLGCVLLRKDTKPLAKELLRLFGSIKGALDARPAELLEVSGFGESLLGYWLLFREMMARYVEASARQREKISCAADVVTMAKIRLAALAHEEVWVIYLDTQNHLLVWKKVSQGTVNTVAFYPREIIETALQLKAAAFILVHNHPGSNPTPSASDIDLTKKLVNAANALGMRLIDHIVVTDNDYRSFNEDGLL